LIPLLDRSLIFLREIPETLGIAARFSFYGKGLVHCIPRFRHLCISSFNRKRHIQVQDGQGRMSRLHLRFQRLGCVLCLLNASGGLAIIQSNKHLALRHRRTFPDEQFLDTSWKLARDSDVIALDSAVRLNQTVRESLVQDPPVERNIAASAEDDGQGSKGDRFS
jgi:hypothetical protein